jgi:16S rRNA (guanine966-N2)-methyltransferase
VASLRASQQRLKVADRLQVEPADALAWMARAAPASFELVLLDPPFDSPLQAPALLAAAPLPVPGGWLYLESPAALSEADLPAGFALWRQGRAGLVHYHLLQRNS